MYRKLLLIIVIINNIVGLNSYIRHLVTSINNNVKYKRLSYPYDNSNNDISKLTLNNNNALYPDSSVRSSEGLSKWLYVSLSIFILIPLP